MINQSLIFRNIGLCLCLSNSSPVDSLEGFRKPVVDNIKLDTHILMKHNH